MAGRPIKQGVDYFPLSVSLFSDVKIRKILKSCGPNSVSVLICLLCNIYRENGYYILWDEDLPFFIADEVGVSEGCVKEIILKAIQVGFFDVEKHSAYGILTSYGIQKRFFEITKRRNETEIKHEYLINADNNSINVCNNSINVCNNEHKGKERKYYPLTPFQGEFKNKEKKDGRTQCKSPPRLRGSLQAGVRQRLLLDGQGCRSNVPAASEAAFPTRAEADGCLGRFNHLRPQFPAFIHQGGLDIRELQRDEHQFKV